MTRLVHIRIAPALESVLDRQYHDAWNAVAQSRWARLFEPEEREYFESFPPTPAPKPPPFSGDSALGSGNHKSSPAPKL
jgi:hypothetical protein